MSSKLKIGISLLVGVPLILANIFFYSYFGNMLNFIATIVLTMSMLWYIHNELFFGKF